MNTNRSMPPGIVIPELPYPDVREAVDWLCRSFGFVERLRIGNHRAQLSFSQGSVIVTKRMADPDSITIPVSVMVRLDNIDSHYERVVQSGAQIINAPTDYPYGERQYTVKDPGGHHWTFSQTMMDVNPEVWGGLLLE